MWFGRFETRSTLLGVALFALLPQTLAFGDLIEFTFSGNVTSVDMNDGLFAAHPLASAQVGDPYTFTYRFESSTPDSNGSANTGEYHAVQSARVTIDSAEFQYDTLSIQRIVAVNDATIAGDVYEVVLKGVDGATNVLDTDFALVDQEGGAFSSDALPTTLDLLPFETRVGAFGIQGVETTAGRGPFDAIQVNVNSFRSEVVPLPGGVLLALTGLPLAVWLKRRLA